MLNVLIRHWLPIITFCPVNYLPDVIYVTLEFENFAELYGVRKKMRKLLNFKRMFMEDAAKKVLDNFPTAKACEVRLAFSRHVALVTR